MSYTKVIDVPEVEMEVSKLINKMLHLSQGYRQVQMKFLHDEINLPIFARLFELIHRLEMENIDEIIRFQIIRGQKVTWFDVKPVENIEKGKPWNIIHTILELEKEIHQITIRLDKLSWEKGDLPLTAFLQDRIIPRQVKVIRKRANQLRDLKRTEDDITPFLTERLNVRFEVEKLEVHLRLEILRSEHITHNLHEKKKLGDKEILMIGSTTRF